MLTTLSNFFKTSLLGGLVVVLPFLLFWVLMDEVLGLIVALAIPIADLFPAQTFDHLSEPSIAAALLILLTSFIFGVAIRLELLAKLGRWLESATLGKLPIYRAIKQLSTGLIGVEGGAGFKGGLWQHDDGSCDIVYIIETLSDDRVVILVPFAPASFTGSVKVVAAAFVQELDASAGEVSKVIANWGVGATEMLAEEKNIS
ncbi:hypothetical protein EYC98_05000 [Halieaceae bacterium IMCC14734]|uniref:DUF502 domain-containing protein n=1 Tax=Candidatus Litorirhabdus singularis TaxID=2518993 RepID=A0ABT3TDZ9_9GAMM|nr:hypothetical protein [Candidatus Litorirhabdus singularis]MCX2980224.1 hypothetical protein [Candidatus Litorirhabdus singularis]